MAPIRLSDEETRVIFGDEALSGLGDLEASQQRQILRRLLDIMEKSAPPSAYVYEQIQNLDIYTAGGKMRIYAKAVDNIPRENTMYHVIYVFYIDEGHDYDRSDLAEFNPQAEIKLERITSLETVPDVERYFEEHDAQDSDDIRDMLA